MLGLLLHQIHAARDIFFLALLLEPRAYLRARLRGRDDVEPVTARPTVRLVRDDGNDVAVL